MTPILLLILLSISLPLSIQRRYRGGGDNILVEMAEKSKLGELEDEVREVFSRHFRKEFNGVV